MSSRGSVLLIACECFNSSSDVRQGGFDFKLTRFDVLEEHKEWIFPVANLTIPAARGWPRDGIIPTLEKD
jgi:hypothetical protein